jgi:hypothetical protein
MISTLLCLFAFLTAYAAGRRSLRAGVVATLSAGYVYGILRANLPETLSHFIFDAAVLGLYASRLAWAWRRAGREMQTLQRWLFFLLAWPVILLLVPVQDPLVELVGLRGNIFFLPFILLGACLESRDLSRISLWLAGLNLFAFVFAVLEYQFGVDRFFPLREGVTSIIYSSKDLVQNTEFRIPATFSGAHAYASTMTMTIPFLAGAWLDPQTRLRHRLLLAGALAASSLGVFMAAARTHIVILFVLLAIVTFSRRLSVATQLGWVMMLIGLGALVLNEERLQRFFNLKDTAAVSARLSYSMHDGVLSAAATYPMGNGLGGGGTSMPYFLQNRVRKTKVAIESEYVRIMMEQGAPGLILWVAFLCWAMGRGLFRKAADWRLGHYLALCVCVAYFSTGLVGVGTLTSIPQTCLLMMATGWLASGSRERKELHWRPAPDLVCGQAMAAGYGKQ